MNAQDTERMERAKKFAHDLFQYTGHLMMTVMAWNGENVGLVVVSELQDEEDKNAAEHMILEIIDRGANAVAVVNEVWITRVEPSKARVRTEAVCVTYSCLRGEKTFMADIKRSGDEVGLEEWKGLKTVEGRFCNFWTKVQAHHAEEN